MIVLGIETSCDETSLSIIDEDNTLLSNIIVSQNSTHSPHGGIIPELASRPVSYTHLTLLTNREV